MSKPVKEITVTTVDEKTGTVQAVFDTGSFYTLLREDKVPAGAAVLWHTVPREYRAASKGSKLTVTASLELVMSIGEKMINDLAYVSPDLAQEMLIGAKTMQAWDVSIVNTNGKTEIVVGHDLRDPMITEVD